MAAAVATTALFATTHSPMNSLHSSNSNHTSSNSNNNEFVFVGFAPFLYQSTELYFPIDWFSSVNDKATVSTTNDAEPLIIGDLFDDDVEVVVPVAPAEESVAHAVEPAFEEPVLPVPAQETKTEEEVSIKEEKAKEEEEEEEEDDWECPSDDDWEDDDVYDDMDDEFEKGQRWERRIYNPKNHNGLIERSKQENKKEKINKRFVCAARYHAEIERRQYARDQYSAAHENSRRDRELQQALEASKRAAEPVRTYKRNPNPPGGRTIKKSNNAGNNANNGHVHSHNHNTGHPAAAVLDRSSIAADISLTLAQIQELQNRELTPEDYELLLLLDASLPKKTVSKSLIDEWETVTVNEDSDAMCCICMCNYTKGEKMKILPCSHRFHLDCIETWLTKSSVNCPVDGLPLKKD